MPEPKNRLRLPANLLLAFYGIAMFAGTHWPTMAPGVQNNLDKVYHFAAYAGLTFLILLWWLAHRGLTWRGYLAVICLVGLLGAIDEVTQIPVGRSADVRDWIADMLGAHVGAAGFMYLRWVLQAPRAVASSAGPRDPSRQ